MYITQPLCLGGHCSYQLTSFQIQLSHSLQKPLFTVTYTASITSSSWAVSEAQLAAQLYTFSMMTCKPSKPGQTDLVFGL